MILKSITLQNIRSYKNEKIEFPRGITLFEGDVGSGKSSALMGIEFALFGLGSQKPDALLSKKAKDGSVVLNFEVNGINYEIARNLKKRQNSVSQDSGYLLSNDVREDLSSSELKQRVLQILKFNEPSDPRSGSRIYRYAVFTPQEEMKEILRDSERRLETLRKAFGIEDYKIATENAINILRVIDKKSAILEERFKDLGKLNTEFDNVQKDIQNIETEIQKLENNKKPIEQKRNEVNKRLVEARKKEMEKIKLDSNLQQITTEISGKNSFQKSYVVDLKTNEAELKTILEETSKLKKIERPTTKTIEQLENEIRNAREIEKTIEKIQSQISNLSSNVTELLATIGKEKSLSIQSLNKKIEKLQLEVKKDKENLATTKLLQKKQQKKEGQLEGKLTDLTSKLRNLGKLGAKCPICESTLTKKHIQNLEKERKNELQKTKNELDELKSELDSTSSKIDNLDDITSEKNDAILELKNKVPLLNKLEEKRRGIESLQNTLTELKSKNKTQEERGFPNDGKFKDPESYLNALKYRLIEFNNAENDIQKLETNKIKIVDKMNKIKKNQQTLRNEISQLQSNLNNINIKLKSFADVTNEIDEAESEYSKLNTEFIDLGNMISTNDAHLENSQSKLTELKEKISNAKKSESEHSRYGNYYEWIKQFFIPTIELIEKQVMLSIQQNFNNIYQNWYSVLIEDPSKESRIDEDFTPIMEQDGYDQEIDYLSGGEKTSIALAYRLTLNTMMRRETESLKSNLLILDEPTDGFSKSQLSKIRSILEELHSEQIILVSHEKELETYVDNIFHITKENGESHVSRKSS